MKRAGRVAVLMASVVPSIGFPVARAHFHVLLPQEVNVPLRGEVQVTYWVGHPFERVLTDTEKPSQFFAVSPEGRRHDLLPALRESSLMGQEGKSFRIWQAAVRIPRRGDYVLAAVSEPAIEEGVAHQAFVKTVLHAKVQKGWDQVLNLPGEFVPLTRPYGLIPGMVFQVQLLKDGKPLAGAMVEFEKHNERPVPEDKLPAEEFVTRVVKTDPNGVATMNLPEAGWWGISAEVHGGHIEVDGKPMPAVWHATYWIFIDSPPQGG